MIDIFTLEVLRHRLRSITEEMQMALLRSAYSNIIKESSDASTGLFDPKGEMIAQSTALPAQLGMLVPAVNSIIKNFPVETMHEGDIFILNDPYEGGSHLPDIVIALPLIYKGEVVALSCSIAHHQEIGGKTPGSVPTDATEIFQEGLRIPPLKLYEKGQPNETLFHLIRKNVRIPDIVTGDIRAQIAADNVGRNRLSTLLDEYGKEEIKEYIRELLNRTETMTRAKISQIPDGSYSFTDYLDHDGIEYGQLVKIQVTVIVNGSELTFDFNGTSPQVRGPFNSDIAATTSCVYFTVRAITADPSIPSNSGCYRPVRIILPPGTLVNPLPPAPVSCRTATMYRLVDTMLGALVKAIPNKIPAAPCGVMRVIAFGGNDPRNGKTYVFSDLTTGGMGARPNKEGIDTIDTGIGNVSSTPAEAVEMNFPVRIIKNRLWEESGGAGKFRGGLGCERVFELLRGEATISHREERHLTSPWGLFGGLAAKTCKAFIKRKNGNVENVPSKMMYKLFERDQIHTFVTGGAGYGDPLTRDPEKVLEDVLDRKISLETAKVDYGVVVDASIGGKVLNHGATMELRKKMASKRNEIFWTYDRGEKLGKE